MNHRQVAIAFLEKFCRCDLEAIASMLAEDFKIDGPYLQGVSKTEYLQSLKNYPPQKSRYKIERVFESDQEVCLIYNYIKKEKVLLISQVFTIRENLITGMLLVFDTGA